MSGEEESLGALRADDAGLAVRFERRYDATPEEVWAAVTEPASIARWLFADAVLEPRAGGAFRARWGEEDRVGGTVLRWEPPRLLETEWLQTDLRSVLRIEIAPAGEGALLVLDHRRLSAAPAVRVGAGWHAHLDALGALLGRGDAAAPGDAGAWRERYAALRPRYAAAVAAASG